MKRPALKLFARYYVRPTQLRLKKEYIIYYHTWTWVVFTGKAETCVQNCFPFEYRPRACEGNLFAKNKKNTTGCPKKMSHSDF